MGLLLRPQSLLIGVNVLVTLSLLNFLFFSPGILRSRTYSTSLISPSATAFSFIFPIQITAYIGDDYPIEIPLPKDTPFISMTLHETVHYELNISNPTTKLEWDELMRYPKGFGRLHLGPSRKTFTPVFWHQLHCVRELGRGIQDRNHPISSKKHIKHCINYLRQTILCDADHFLEEGDFTQRDFEVERDGGSKMCRDWDTAEAVLHRQMLEFFEWAHRND